MDNKLSELSKPVAWPNGCNETAVEALRYLAEKPRPSYGNSPFNTEHLYMIASEIKRMADQSLYSQEYVSALLADNEAKERRIAELEEREKRVVALAGGNADLWETMAARLEAAEAKLATPVRLKKVDSSNVPFAGDGFNAAVDYCAKAVRAAGFTVDGDE